MDNFAPQRAMKGFSTSQAEQLKEIGNYLRQQREQQSLSLAEVASSTFIHLPVLEALEAGAVESLPEPIYVRGFIRRYSEMLQVDGDALIQKLYSLPEAARTAAPADAANRLTESAAQPINLVENVAPVLREETTKELPSVSREVVPVKGTPGIPLWAYLLGLAAAVGLGAWYFLSRPPAFDTTSDTTLEKTPAPTVPVSPSLTPPPVSPSPTPPATVPLSATVTMVGNSWLQVKVDGKTAYEGTLARGQTKRWTAQKQLVLKAGNAGAVNLSVNQAKPQLMGSLGKIKEVVLAADGNQAEN
jgi:cytoskeletal protein RodZ